MPKKVLFIVSNANAIGPHHRRTGNFLPEVAHPYGEFDRAKYQVDFATLSGDTPYLDALNLAGDPDNLAFLTGKGWADMQKAKKLSDVDVGNRRDLHARRTGTDGRHARAPLLKKVVKETYERKAIVGAVCHGPVSLLNVKLSDGSYLVAGKNISSFTDDEEENYAKQDVPFMLESALTEQGAISHKTDPWQPFSIARRQPRHRPEPRLRQGRRRQDDQASGSGVIGDGCSSAIRFCKKRRSAGWRASARACS